MRSSNWRMMQLMLVLIKENVVIFSELLMFLTQKVIKERQFSKLSAQLARRFVPSSLMEEVVQIWLLNTWWRNSYFQSFYIQIPTLSNGSIKAKVNKLLSKFFFSIDKIYKEKLLCDIIPMNVCHVLLGRPWQYDRRVLDYHFKNTHTFTEDKKNIVVTALIRSSKPQSLAKLM